jgi:hypothetical protein
MAKRARTAAGWRAEAIAAYNHAESIAESAPLAAAEAFTRAAAAATIALLVQQVQDKR